MKKILSLFFVFFLQPALYAQYKVNGKIIFANDNRPVTGASVFFSNTSFGTVSAADGSFQFSNISAGNYDLVVSYVGYETVQTTVTITNANAENIIISLKLKPKELEAVIVGGYEKQGWEKWGKFFTEQFIGSGSWGNNCTLENYKEIEFRMYKKANKLVAFCDAELLISNRNLGYRIKYRLEKFEYDFSTNMLLYEGYPLFENMETKRAAKQRRWAKARNEAYHGSIMHFMRSLYRNKLTEEGFEIRRLVKIPNLEKKRVRQLYKQHALQMNQLPADSTDYYERILSQKDVTDKYAPYTIGGDSIAYALDSFTAVLEFENHLYIVYKKALEDADYARMYSGSSGQKNPASAVTLLNEKNILVYANGTYYKMQNFLTNGYWAWSEKICRMLPFDYKPPPE